MAWNEPSNNGDGNKPNNQDPWKRNRNSQSDDLNFDVSKWIKKLFGGKSGPSNSNKNGLGFLAIGYFIVKIIDKNIGKKEDNTITMTRII